MAKKFLISQIIKRKKNKNELFGLFGTKKKDNLTWDKEANIAKRDMEKLSAKFDVKWSNNGKAKVDNVFNFVSMTSKSGAAIQYDKGGKVTVDGRDVDRKTFKCPVINGKVDGLKDAFDYLAKADKVQGKANISRNKMFVGENNLKYKKPFQRGSLHERFEKLQEQTLHKDKEKDAIAKLINDAESIDKNLARILGVKSDSFVIDPHSRKTGLIVNNIHGYDKNIVVFVDGNGEGGISVSGALKKDVKVVRNLPADSSVKRIAGMIATVIYEMDSTYS